LDDVITYGGAILHSNLRGAWKGHGLGLIWEENLVFRTS